MKGGITAKSKSAEAEVTARDSGLRPAMAPLAVPRAFCVLSTASGGAGPDQTAEGPRAKRAQFSGSGGPVCKFGVGPAVWVLRPDDMPGPRGTQQGGGKLASPRPTGREGA